MNEKLYQAKRTSSDIEVGKDRIFKKNLNPSYPRTFIYSVLNAFNDMLNVFNDMSIH